LTTAGKGSRKSISAGRDQEALEKLRAKISVAEQAKAAGKSSMKCPRCGATLAESKLEGVSIDTCENCGGVWLDSGELQQLTAKESGWFERLWKKSAD
jgi:hypothetical protein